MIEFVSRYEAEDDDTTVVWILQNVAGVNLVNSLQDKQCNYLN